MSKQKNIPIAPNKKKKNPPTKRKLKAALSQLATTVLLPKQTIKITGDEVKAKASCFTPASAAVGSKIRTLPKQEHLSVFGTPLLGKVSAFTVRSTLPSKQTSLPAMGAATKGASNFTIRSGLPEREPVSGEFSHPLPGPTRFELVRRVFFYLSQLLCLNFLLIALCCYIAGFTQWGKLMIIMGITWNVCLLTVVAALLIQVRMLLQLLTLVDTFVSFRILPFQCDLTALFSAYYLIVILVTYIISLIPYVVHESTYTQTIFEISVCLIDLFVSELLWTFMAYQDQESNSFFHCSF